MGRQLTGGRGQGGTFKKETVARVIKSFSPYKDRLFGIGIAVLVAAVLGLLPPLFLRTIINHGLLGRNMSIVAWYSVYTILAVIGSTMLTLAFSYLSIAVGQGIMRDLRNQLYDHLQGMSLRFFSSTRTGEIQSRLANDVGGVQSVVSDTATSVLSNVVTVVSTLVLMFIMDWRLTLLSVGVLPIFAVLGARVGGMARSVRATVQALLADMSATMQETLSVSGVLLTKTSGRRALALNKFAAKNEDLTAAQIKQSMVMRFFFNLINLTFSITPALVYWLAGYLVVVRADNSLSVGTIVAFTALQSRLFFPLTTLFNTQVDLTSSLALFDRIFEYLDLKQEIVDAPDAIALNPDQIRGQVTFENVAFRYVDDALTPEANASANAAGKSSPEPNTAGAGNWGAGAGSGRWNAPSTNGQAPPTNPKARIDEGGDTKWTLQDISFEARSGQLIALVGHSGAGKTTLTYLIPRLYDAVNGTVRIDGHDVKKIKLDSLGQAIGVVTQETYLIHDTIRENLRYGKPDASDEELVTAARTAAIHDHISSLPNGYDTIVGERGYKLSGGEKQRVAIARAILKNPRILILDEATSSLDTQSERLIQTALEPLMAGRTTFAIAHRLSTILAADLILVLERGRIVERGTHETLLAQAGAYAALYAAQFDNGNAEVAVGE